MPQQGRHSDGVKLRWVRPLVLLLPSFTYLILTNSLMIKLSFHPSPLARCMSSPCVLPLFIAMTTKLLIHGSGNRGALSSHLDLNSSQKEDLISKQQFLNPKWQDPELKGMQGRGSNLCHRHGLSLGVIVSEEEGAPDSCTECTQLFHVVLGSCYSYHRLMEGEK